METNVILNLMMPDRTGPPKRRTWPVDRPATPRPTPESMMIEKLMGRGNRFDLFGRLICQRKTVALVLACLIQPLSSCNRASESNAEPAAPPAQRASIAERKPPLPSCPDAPYPVLQATDAGTGHHKVFLAWNPSASANPMEPDALGYCLYRTQSKDAKRCPQRSDCEKVTPVPLFTTRCVDDLVKDRTKYHYVAIAINSQGKISSPTKEAIVNIPDAGQQNPAPSDAASFPACRAPAGPSPAPH